MKRLRCWFVSTAFLISLFWGATVIAQTDLLNLDSYQEGDTPSYGENIVIKQDEKTGIKWITGIENSASGRLGKLKYSTNLSGDFEIFIKADHGAMKIFLIANDEYKIELNFCNNCAAIKVGDSDAGDDQSQAWTIGINQIRFAVVNDVAKLYANDVFSKKISLRPGLTYTQLLVHLDTRDELYELGIGSSSTTSPTTTDTGGSPTLTTPSVSGDCMATYALDGKVHIPCISVPDAFGGTTVYDVKMQQQPGSFTFDLDLTSVKPR